MKRSGSILVFVLFALIVELILLWYSGLSITSMAAVYGLAWAVAIFLLYKTAMDSDETHKSLLSKELFAWRVRKQTSNRLTFAFAIAVMLLPMNGLIFQIELAKLMFQQMAIIIFVDAMFEGIRLAKNKFDAYNFQKCKVTTREGSHNEAGYTKNGNIIGN